MSDEERTVDINPESIEVSSKPYKVLGIGAMVAIGVLVVGFLFGVIYLITVAPGFAQ